MNALNDPPPDDMFMQYCNMIGGYVAEVMIRNDNAIPGLVEFDAGPSPALRLPNGKICWPIGKVQRRVAQGAEHNLVHYYKVFTALELAS